ncbi:hypothetical protein [Cohnella cholangitidis]|uniref:Uncharacterized protein n=1 Tax=Cohnella cholangitidis TaxID=2598458 RepID=A0A7G5C3D2_9BACL|nr:hypothetical protein [Cohnella cholangitidis]QMV43716.1 hypothetical protein FPL14_22995 [Cohnella cholangitidis]
MKRPGHEEIEAALAQIAATSSDYHVAETPERLLELSGMSASFVKIAVETKSVTPSELRLTVALFNQAADKWLRLYEAR